MQSHATISSSMPICEFTDQLIDQIRRFIFSKQPSNTDDIYLSLDYLEAIPCHQAHTLLHVCTQGGWKYAQVLASIEDDRIVQRYIALLDHFRREGVGSQTILELLRLTDPRGFIIGRKAGAHSKQLFLCLLLHLYQSHQPIDSAISIEDIQVLLAMPDKKGKSFLHDIARSLSLSSAGLQRPAYVELACFLINQRFISHDNMALFAPFANETPSYVQQTQPEQAEPPLAHSQLPSIIATQKERKTHVRSWWGTQASLWKNWMTSGKTSNRSGVTTKTKAKKKADDQVTNSIPLATFSSTEASSSAGDKPNVAPKLN